MAEDQDRRTTAQASELPPVTFIGHISELALTAQAYMGGMVDRETQKPIVQLDMARRLIDTIEMLEKKTKGNLEAPERNFLENTLYDLRMTYVRLATAPPESQEPQSPSEASTAQEKATPSEEGTPPSEEETSADATAQGSEADATGAQEQKPQESND